MPMEIIEFVKSEVINVFFNEGGRKEMPANIKMHSPISETRVIIDGEGRNLKFNVWAL